MTRSIEPAQPLRPASTMRAVVQGRYGSEDSWSVEEVARPASTSSGTASGLGNNDVLIEVRAAGLDRGTWHLMAGSPYVVRPVVGLRRPRNPIPGFDVAGVVAAVGEAVSRFAVGDEVYGIGRGSFAEYCIAKESKLSPKPMALSFEQAAATPISGSTALQGLCNVGQLEAGQRVLITGASGGVGSFAVQIAHAAGAHVTGLASTAKLDFVRWLGADDVVAYDRVEHDAPAQPARRRYFAGPEIFDTLVKAGPFDLVLDIAGNPTAREFKSLLTSTGTAVMIGGEGCGKIIGVARQLRAISRSPFIRQRLTMLIASEDHQHLDRLGELIESGEVTPVVDRTFALDGAADAMRQLVNGGVRGKLVIVPSDGRVDGTPVT